ncbi:putative glycoside hydrolase [Paraburkholderia sp. SOS3]|uniref:putative glycoside hydrolase n=1 Tax=Paraburkholderia sp. SOS3 TaxID=1926494 RepID=UPI0009FA71BE|nr:putative glycoside hydrolase [Paraburkholderia sp. SOS3]
MSARWRAAFGTACAALALAAASCGRAAAGTQTAPATASVQTRGVVIDAATRKPIPHAWVVVDGAAQKVAADGRFASMAGVTVIDARAPGYQRARTPVTGDAPVTVVLTPFRPKAVYLSVYGVLSPVLRDAAVKLQESNGINALVIDVKGDRGMTPYPSAARVAIGAAAKLPVHPAPMRDFAALVAELHRDGLYLIARIVVFKDDPLADAHPAWAVHDAQGQVWRDREQLQWIDPFVREAWTHNLDLAEEAARLGFDEVQFDYVRFPDAPGLRFAEPNTRANRTAAITGFLGAARERLARYNVFVSADIFGYVCWNADDTAIGQQIEQLGAALDYISPMLYPSGFTWGLPGCTRPTADPGQIVRRSLAEAQRRTGLPGVRFRPWLQAFRDYAFDHHEFDADEIRAQVDAADAEHTNGWMLWNPRNRYDPAQLPR